MPLLLALTLAATLSASPPADPAPCPDGTTIDLNRCHGDRLAAAEADLARYLAAARRRLGQEAAAAQPGETGVAQARRGLDVAETAWARYRQAACGAVYDYWSAGTIREIEMLDCQITLTRLHTRDLWRQWLTYMDSTPPILPEPPMPADD